MGLLRARADVSAEVVLTAADRAAARILPGPRSSPERSEADAIRMALGLVAAAYGAAPESRVPGFRECLVDLAQALAAPEFDGSAGRLVHLGPLGVREFLTVEPWGPEGRARVTAELVAGRRGEVPRITDAPGFAGPSVEIAGLALVQHVGNGPAGADGRLALALGVEGILAWFAEAHRMSPPRDALRFALAHADERLGGAGRPGVPHLFD
jgi:hypothetical protein